MYEPDVCIHVAHTGDKLPPMQPFHDAHKEREQEAHNQSVIGLFD